VSPLNILLLVRRACAPVSGPLGGIGLAFTSTPAAVPVAPGVYALKATRCIHLVPAFGRIGICTDIDALARYFAALDAHVRTRLAVGVGLAELPARCDLPEFAAWDGYAALHVQSANHAYPRMERDSFNDWDRDARAFRNKV
jgi:hypothetical protein